MPSRESKHIILTRVLESDDSGTDRSIADIFMELPDRRLFNDYYRTIKEPVSLREIEVSLARLRNIAPLMAGSDDVPVVRALARILPRCRFDVP